MATFPHESLVLLSEGMSVSYDTAVLRSEMDAGPPKVRAYKCKTMKVIKAVYHACECDSVQVFETWWKEETKLGSRWFKYQDPCTAEFIKARFRSEPTWSSSTQNLNDWRLSVEIETWC